MSTPVLNQPEALLRRKEVCVEMRLAVLLHYKYLQCISQRSGAGLRWKVQRVTRKLSNQTNNHLKKFFQTKLKAKQIVMNIFFNLQKGLNEDRQSPYTEQESPVFRLSPDGICKLRLGLQRNLSKAHLWGLWSGL